MDARVPVLPLRLALALATASSLFLAAAVYTPDAVRATTGVRTGSVTVTGAGFGHGVGMSQYGAYGMAKAGTSGPDILRHYYTGTTVAPYPDRVDVLVNVVDRGTGARLSSTRTDGTPNAFRLLPEGAPGVTVPAGGSARVSILGSRLAVVVQPASGAATSFTTSRLGVRWSGTRVQPGAASLLQVGSSTRNASTTSSRTRRYRWGSLTLTPVLRSDSDGAERVRLEAVASLDLHSEYLRGVAEMPSSWPAAALQAQVVAIRNYALSAVTAGTRSSCGGCHLYDDTRSQVYAGWQKESERIGRTDYGARWVAAVTATQTSGGTGLAVLYQGKPIPAYFSSSSGGRTRASENVWGSSRPYLKSVDDPWSVDASINPSFAHWSRTVSVTRLLALFGLPDLASVTVDRRDSSGAAVQVTARSSTGRSSSVTGSRFAGRLGLPASWVTEISLPGQAAASKKPARKR